MLYLLRYVIGTAVWVHVVSFKSSSLLLCRGKVTQRISMQLSQTRLRNVKQANGRAGPLRRPRTVVVRAAANVEQLRGAKRDIEALIKVRNR
jgi:hypothetical protein